MTRRIDDIQIEDKIVVFFDICSSTTIIEDLSPTGEIGRWRDVLIGIKEFLISRSRDEGFVVYGFLGDGWILLFDRRNADGAKLLLLLRDIECEYERLFDEHVEGVLHGTNLITGITVGIDSGPLVRLQMNDRDEYVGRALNVAARLQSTVRELVENPQRSASYELGFPPALVRAEGTVLVSINAFAALQLKGDDSLISYDLAVRLRNIANDTEYRIRALSLRQLRKGDHMLPPATPAPPPRTPTVPAHPVARAPTVPAPPLTPRHS